MLALGDILIKALFLMWNYSTLSHVVFTGLHKAELVLPPKLFLTVLQQDVQNHVKTDRR